VKLVTFSKDQDENRESEFVFALFFSNRKDKSDRKAIEYQFDKDGKIIKRTYIIDNQKNYISRVNAMNKHGFSGAVEDN
jgi:Na+-translocating ferredoxin:NAD+ oxidoreductase RnfG subunit